ncbi:NAD(P)/FAD-dependent oxidoreductase [Actinomadura sp. NEAU-AAG7]|uniref:NAD(P)/FAD-dependent oxidoreductase n=1 Tax=Actinomadura sp. NEAU-AAG7 TaxID=2839640 RepID=UPI001BE46725|nr:NAD(P)/FAD-dependent oxidoreductase [Actinomadura sp. NEAU-AAG7]MBT2208763.1 NAD(P)/FAD-dependent oxidoreductase [Actinomadura sp. NEAU-AAG7]
MTSHDVVVVGGGPAGLSAALVLARACRAVAVVDAGRPRNAASAHVHGVLGLPDLSPQVLLEVGRAQVLAYGVDVLEGTARTARPRPEGGFAVTLSDGRVLAGTHLLLATGTVDELPDIPGLAPRWGRDAVACPHCHGWELRGRAIAILGGGRADARRALMWRQWTPNLTLITAPDHPPAPSDLERLGARGITVLDGPVTEVIAAADRLCGVRLGDGTSVPIRALVVAPCFRARADLLDGLGLRPTELTVGGRVVGTVIATDGAGRTAVPGVWAAGDGASPLERVVAVTADGAAVASAINAALTDGSHPEHSAGEP